MCAGKGYQRSAALLVDFHNEDLDLIIHAESLSGDLLGTEQNCTARAGVKHNVSVLGIHLADSCRNDLLVLILISLLHRAALALANTLNDDRLCSCCTQTSEIFGLYLVFQHASHSRSLGLELCVLQADLRLGGLYNLNDLLLLIYTHILLGRVNQHTNVGVVSVLLFVRRNKSGLNLFNHVIGRDSLLLLKQLKGSKKL